MIHKLNPFADGDKVIVLAHRGGSGLRPENTMMAFENAAGMGVDGLELDIHQTKDGRLVVIHDPTLDRISNGSGAIKNMTLADVQSVDAGYWWTADGGKTFPYRGKGAVIPTLEEIFTTFPHLWINIDIKQHTPSIVKPFVKMVRDFGMEARVMVGSFNEPTIHTFRDQCPEASTAASPQETQRLYIMNKLLIGRFYKSNAAALQIPAFYGRWRVVTRRLINAAHQAGTAVHVWTIDEEKDMRHLMDLGVDCLITDYPNRLLQLISNRSLPLSFPQKTCGNDNHEVVETMSSPKHDE